MIDRRHLLVMKRFETFCFQIGDSFVEKFHNLFDGVFRRKDKASVGQSLMTVKMSDAIELHLIGRQEGNQASLVVKKHQRMVEETITMIVHIVTFEEEGSILRSTDKGVPYRLIAARISMDVHAWARYFR